MTGETIQIAITNYERIAALMDPRFISFAKIKTDTAATWKITTAFSSYESPRREEVLEMFVRDLPNLPTLPTKCPEEIAMTYEELSKLIHQMRGDCHCACIAGATHE